MPNYSQHSGENVENAIIISNAENTNEGIEAEYVYLARQYGQRGRNWRLKLQSLLHHEGKHYDLMHIVLHDGSEKQIYFDITAFFGKF
jgi:predicted RNA-binding protein associated with RNAse of E/G family